LIGPVVTEFLFTRPLFLIVLSAIAYSAATVGMKMASVTPGLFAVVIITLGFGAAVATEIVLMQRYDLGILYIAIIAAETLIVLAVASAIGEGLNLRQSLGALLVLVGIGIAAT
jgi:hypothetical protein